MAIWTCTYCLTSVFLRSDAVSDLFLSSGTWLLVDNESASFIRLSNSFLASLSSLRIS